MTRDLDYIDLFLMILTVIILLSYLAGLFIDLPKDENLTQWFLTLVGVFIAKKVPVSLNK